jgi:predicted nucleotidyltransferase
LPVSDGLDLSAKQRETLLSVLSRFAERIERAAVFGSRALGRATAASDIDLALYGSLDDRDLARIWSLLHRSSLAVSVDVVRYEAFGDVPFRRHIDTVAKTLFTRDELLAARTAHAA